jgi:hypothetical protein
VVTVSEISATFLVCFKPIFPFALTFGCICIEAFYSIKTVTWWYILCSKCSRSREVPAFPYSKALLHSRVANRWRKSLMVPAAWSLASFYTNLWQIPETVCISRSLSTPYGAAGIFCNWCLCGEAFIPGLIGLAYVIDLLAVPRCEFAFYGDADSKLD